MPRSDGQCRNLRLQLGNEYRVQPGPDFFTEATALLGEAAVG